MIRVVAVLFLAVLTLAAPARACSTKASTFCADGWLAQPMGGGDRRSRAEEQAGARPDGNSGPDPGFPDNGIHVEGAVVLDGPVPSHDGQL